MLRKKPPGKLIKSAHMVEREFRILRGLAHPAAAAPGDPPFPVPIAYALCEDAAVVGTAFYAMEFVQGRIFTDPSMPGIAPWERKACYQQVGLRFDITVTIAAVCAAFGHVSSSANVSRSRRVWRTWCAWRVPMTAFFNRF